MSAPPQEPVTIADGTDATKSSGATLHHPPSCPLTQDLAKKEAKRKEKEAKLAAKSIKNVAKPASEKKVKVEKEKKVEEAPFVNTTPKGEKKGPSPFISVDLELTMSRSLSSHVCWL